MSLLRKAWNGRTETRAISVGSYGQPGAGTWAEGMVWRNFTAATEGRSLQISAVFACIRILTEAISTLPLDTFQRVDGARIPYRPRPAYLDFAPPHMSKVQYLSQVMLSQLTAGDAFVATPRRPDGTVTHLVPLQPDLVTVRLGETGAKLFDVNGETYTEADILHIPAMILPGQLRGMSPLRAAREVVDGGLMAQDFGRAFFANAGVPPAVIKIPASGMGDSEKEQARAQRIAETWKATHGGVSNAGKVGVLIGGAELQTVAVNPEDAS